MNDETKTVTINIVASIILQGIAFFSMPLFSRLLGSEQYGVFSIYYSWLMIISCFMGGGVSSSIATARYHFSESYYEFRSTLLLFSIGISMVLIAITFVFRNAISNMLGFSAGITMIMFITSLGYSVITYYQKALVYEKKPMTNFIMSTTVSLLVVLISVAFILGMNDNKYLGKVYGTAISYVFMCIFCIASILGKSLGNIKNVKYYRYGIMMGMPIVIHQLANNILTQSDRVMMDKMMISPSEVGVYSLYYSLTSALKAVLTALNTSWCPFYYDDLKEKRKDAIEKKTKNYIELFSLITFIFLMLSREIGKLVGGDEFVYGLNLIPILAVSVYFIFMYQFPVNYEFFNKKSLIIAEGTILASVVNILLNALTIVKYGMYGAAISTAISYCLLFFFHYCISKIFVGGFELKAKLFLPGLLTIAVGCVTYYLFSDYVILRWIIAMLSGCYLLIRILKRKSIF